MRFGVNCGHTKSGAGIGAIGYLNESEEARKVGYRLMEYLKAAGHTVVDCTNDKASSVSANLKSIVALANAQKLDHFVSIHFNARKGRGVETYTYTGNADNYPEAGKVCDNLERLGFVNRGVKKGSHLYVVKNTNARAMLIEVCFVDTESDAELYRNLGADAIAKAIYNAITGNAVAESTLKEDCDLLASAGIINSPDYWAKGVEYSDENTALLIKKFAAYVRGTKR